MGAKSRLLHLRHPDKPKKVMCESQATSCLRTLNFLSSSTFTGKMADLEGPAVSSRTSLLGFVLCDPCVSEGLLSCGDGRKMRMEVKEGTQMYFGHYSQFSREVSCPRLLAKSTPSKDVCTLVPRTCENISLYGKKGLWE